jgi:hypothetical protein
MFVCPSGDVFIGSIDTTREYKDAHYICNALAEYIKTIGVSNIIQICTNNASSMRSVPNLLIYHFPSPYFSSFCCSLFEIAIGRLGKNNMGKTNYEKKNYFLFHTMHY